MLCRLYGAQNVVLAGDSAGGCLSMATLLNTSTVLPPPAGLALFSPWLDLRNEATLSDSMRRNAPETGGLRQYGHGDYLPVRGVSLVSYAYASTADRMGALVSPALATAAQLTPFARKVAPDEGAPYHMRAFVTWGTDEILLDQQAGFAKKLQAAGVDTTTYAATSMPHDAAIVAAGLVYTSGLGFCGVGDYSRFEPTRTWARFFGWLKQIPGWEATRVPDGW